MKLVLTKTERWGTAEPPTSYINIVSNKGKVSSTTLILKVADKPF